MKTHSCSFFLPLLLKTWRHSGCQVNSSALFRVESPLSLVDDEVKYSSLPPAIPCLVVLWLHTFLQWWTTVHIASQIRHRMLLLFCLRTQSNCSKTHLLGILRIHKCWLQCKELFNFVSGKVINCKLVQCATPRQQKREKKDSRDRGRPWVQGKQV